MCYSLKDSSCFLCALSFWVVVLLFLRKKSPVIQAGLELKMPVTLSGILFLIALEAKIKIRVLVGWCLVSAFWFASSLLRLYLMDGVGSQGGR